MIFSRKFFPAIALMLITISGFSQTGGKVIDEVVAVVGSEMIMLSDVENQYLQYKSSSYNITRCEVLDDLLLQKLMVNQAAIDSIEVNEANVEMELDNRIRYFISTMGSKEKFESFYGKSVGEIKDEFREVIREQMIVETLKGNIIANMKITPTEVKDYFNRLSFSDIPEIPTEYEIGVITKQPEVSAFELEESYNKLAEIRKRIIDGEDFETMAILYSEDPGSAKNGGAIGTVGRGDTYPEFEATAFALKVGEISDIVKSQAGYHIIKMLSRKGDYIDVEHILLVPKASPYDLYNASKYLDSIYNVIKKDTMSFETAARKYSDDPNKTNGGIVINTYTGNTWFDANQLGQFDNQLFFIADKLNVGEISRPSKALSAEGNELYRLVFLKSRTAPHKATLKDDYSKIQSLAEEEKKTETMAKWIKTKAAKTYIIIKDDYLDCDILKKWMK